MMNGKRFALLTGLALLGSLVAGIRAEAAYSYTSVLTINSGTGGGGIVNNTATPGGISTYTLPNGSQLQFQNTAGGLFIPNSPLSPVIANVGLVPASATPTTFSVNYTDTFIVTNPSPGGSTGTFTITGTLTVTNAAVTGGQFSGTTSNTYATPLAPGTTLTIDGNTFTVVVSGLQDVGYATPTIGQPVTATGAGSLSINLTSAPTGTIPEPTSVVMLGLGLAGVVGVGRLRRAA